MTFTTERLIIRPLQESDRESFFDLMSNPNITSPIPQTPFDRTTSDQHFDKLRNPSTDDAPKVWALDSKTGNSCIGLAAYLKNDQNQDEIGYRLREPFWGYGYGTEVAKGLIDYGFNELKLDLITADVNTENDKSVKILDKFFERMHEFYNEDDQCTDRRYQITRDAWFKM